MTSFYMFVNTQYLIYLTQKPLNLYRTLNLNKKEKVSLSLKYHTTVGLLNLKLDILFERFLICSAVSMSNNGFNDDN